MEFSILSFICETLVFIPVMVGLKTHASWKQIPVMKFLAGLVLSTFLLYLVVLPSDIILFAGGDAPNSIFYYNWQYIVGFYIKLSIYFLLLTSKYKLQIVLFFGLVMLVFISFEFKTDSLLWHQTDKFITKTYLVGNLQVVILSLFYAYQQLRDLTVPDITKYSYFWLNAGFMTYHIGSISIYAFVGNGASETDAQIAWVVNAVVLFFSYFTQTLAFKYAKFLR